jgi:muconolactone delta-isomerase
MKYLVQMKLANSSRPATPQEGIVFIEQVILPTLELCRKLEAEKRIIAGGPVSGSVALSLLVSAESAQEVDDLVTSLPVWPRMETTVTPLNSFEGRMQTVRARLDELKQQVRDVTTVQ